MMDVKMQVVELKLMKIMGSYSRGYFAEWELPK